MNFKYTDIIVRMGVAILLFTYSESLQTASWPAPFDQACKSRNVEQASLAKVVELTINPTHILGQAQRAISHGQYEAAIEQLGQIRAHCEDQRGEAKDSVCQCWLLRALYLQGEAYRLSGNLHQAGFYFQRIQSIGATTNQPAVELRGLIELGKVQSSLEEYFMAYKTITLAEELVAGAPDKLAVFRNEVLRVNAALLSSIGVDTLAEQKLRQAKEIAKAEDDLLAMLEIDWLDAKRHQQHNRYTEAKASYNQSRALAQTIQDEHWMAKTRLGLASLAYAEGQLIEAADHLAHLVYQAGDQLTTAEKATAYGYWGLLELTENHLDSAFLYCEAATNLAHVSSDRSVRQLSYECLYQVYKAQGDWEMALLAQEDAWRISEELDREAMSRQLEAVRFESKIKAIEQEQIQAHQLSVAERNWMRRRVDMQSTWIFLLAIMVGISLLLAAWGYRASRKQKQQAKQLAELNSQLSDSNILLADRNGSLQQLNTELEDANHALENFAAVAAHDLKAPLRTIHSFAQLLKLNLGEQLGTTEQEYFAYINQGTRRLGTLIDDLLQFSRVGKQANQLTTVDLNIVGKQVLRDLHQLITEKDAQIQLATLPHVQGHPTLLAQVFQNLISNSLKFAAPERKPVVRVFGEQLDNGCQRLHIQDNGIGIPSSAQEKVFDLFTRLHTAQQYEGSGVGLATCRKIIQALGGKISISSTEGEGTMVSFDLPSEK